MSGWSGNAQTVACAGVLADETKQEVSVCPAADGKLTFTCGTAPSEELTVYVKIQNL